MGAFGTTYAKLYDCFYSDKDYETETDYIVNLIKSYHPQAKTILDIGCGTGRHAYYLSQKGYRVHGIDKSNEMLEIANKKYSGKKVNFSLGDARDFQLDNCFHVIISLFHVLSYQTTNQDIESFFQSVSKHLEPGGIFVCDCWYGPAVLTEKPTIRVKKYRDKDIELTRIANPKINYNENIVDVSYEIYINFIEESKFEKVTENHTMRYLFKPELDMFLSKFNFKIISYFEFLTNKLPDTGSWSVCFISRKE